MSYQNPYDSIPLMSRDSNAPLPLDQYLGQISTFMTRLQTFSTEIQDLPKLHDEALNSTEAATAGASTSHRLESTIAAISAQSAQLKDFLKALERDVLLTERDGNPGDGETKRAQWEKRKKDLQAAYREFQNVEYSYRQRYQDQLARQYRIVNPEASQDEVQNAVNSGETQIFSQAILKSNRSASANSVARAVRERQVDIQRIEKTLEELANLFEQMEELVVLQEPMIEHIEESSRQVEQDVEKAGQELHKGVEIMAGYRKRKWILLGIAVAIIAVIVIALIIYFMNRK